MPSAIIDLGTNTFHVLIFENDKILYKLSLAAKMGMGGIEKGVITPEAIERSIKVLQIFREKLDEYKVEQVQAYGTSALRSAQNKEEVIKAIWEATQIPVKVIDGLEEAELIYKGVKGAVQIDQPSLIVDIGGGSVEFIICNEEKVLWLKSFEIGGQRLLERYMKKDPLPMGEVQRMDNFFREALLPLLNAVHQYHPKVLVGSSGSFDTLNDMYYMHQWGHMPPQDQAGFDYPMAEFGRAFEKLLFNSREQRMLIPGMKELRVDMIVVAMVLIKYLIQNLGINQIKISNYALKEGAMFSHYA